MDPPSRANGCRALRRLERQELTRHTRSGSCVFVLEEDVRRGPGLLPDLLGPTLQGCLVVLLPPQPEISPIRRRPDRRSGLVVDIGDAQCTVSASKLVQNLVLEPRSVTELERGAGSRRQQ